MFYTYVCLVFFIYIICIRFLFLFIFKSFYRCILLYVKVQSCKFYNNKYMIASTKITNTDVFAFIACLVFKLLSHKVLFIKRKDNRNCYFFKKQQISRVNYFKIISSWNAKVSRYFWNTLVVVFLCFFNLHGCTFKDQISAVLVF